MKLLELHARELSGYGDDWRVFRYTCMPLDSLPTIYYALVGAVCTTTYKSGPRKGQTNWRARDRSTEKTVNIKVEDHQTWIKDWEVRTGRCANCVGEGTTVSGWSREKGTTRRTCGICGGNGKARHGCGIKE